MATIPLGGVSERDRRERKKPAAMHCSFVTLAMTYSGARDFAWNPRASRISSWMLSDVPIQGLCWFAQRAD
jgi:hypothetical protein